jgi:hypothetical protein
MEDPGTISMRMYVPPSSTYLELLVIEIVGTALAGEMLLSQELNTDGPSTWWFSVEHDSDRKSNKQSKS